MKANIIVSVKMQSHDQTEDSEFTKEQLLERKLEESMAEIEVLKLGYKPEVVYHPIDMNDFVGDTCIYLIHITEDYFKFGLTVKFVNRGNTHFANFQKQGYKPQYINAWKCISAKAMWNVENAVKQYIKQHRIRVKFAGETEIIKTDDIQHIVDKINSYVEHENEADIVALKIKHIELTIEEKRVDNRHLELSIQEKEMDYRKLELEFEILKFKNKTTHESLRINQRLDGILNGDDLANSGEDIVIKDEMDDRKADAIRWISQNLPKHKEATVGYYEKYKTTKNHPLPANQFGPCVRDQGYYIIKGNKGNYWAKNT
jgi:hypothetical protein